MNARTSIVAIVVLFSLSMMGCVSMSYGPSLEIPGDTAHLVEGLRVKLRHESDRDTQWALIDADGQEAYWITRRHLFGAFESFGSSAIQEQQQAYNTWVASYKQRASKNVAIVGSGFGSSVGWMMYGRRPYRRRFSYWGQEPHELFSLPVLIPAKGELDLRSLMIPFYIGGTRIVDLWQHLTEDCKVLPTNEAPINCDIQLTELKRWPKIINDDQQAEELFQKPGYRRYLDEPLILYRALEIARAFNASLTLEAYIDSCMRELRNWHHRHDVSSLTPEKFWKKLLPVLRRWYIEIDIHITAAERAESAYRMQSSSHRD